MNNNSDLFNVTRSQSIEFDQLHFFDQKMEIPNQKQRIFVEKLDVESKPFLDIIKPHLNTFIKGASSSFTLYGSIIASKLGKIMNWGYDKLKNYLHQTVQSIGNNKFIFIPFQKSQQSQKSTIQDIQHNSIKYLDLKDFNQLQPVINGKVQLIVPSNQQFIDYLKKQNYTIQKRNWQDAVDKQSEELTKSIILPSESFQMIYQQLMPQKKKLSQEKVPKIVYDFGNFCRFDFEDKNQLENQFFNKLKQRTERIQGVMIPVKDLNDSSRSDDFPDDENSYIKNEIQTKQLVIPEKIKQIPRVIDIKPIQQQQEQVYIYYS